ncbi:hypothetical protein AB0H88_51390 [Nonomuraea sp. NPDC050680]|uniref:hypothetical protein n=1 Tax=Nonomuraea sp. NPDC050680 TaxID=3154630 RepID=UPI0033DFA515
MSSDTFIPVKGVVWAGRILVSLAGLHLLAMSLLSADHIPGWLGGELWFFPPNVDDLARPTPSMGAFWLTWGSFAVPLGLIGALVVGFGRRGQVPPPYLGIGVALWALVGAAVFEPSPFVLGVVPAALLLGAARRRRAVAA